MCKQTISQIKLTTEKYVDDKILYLQDSGTFKDVEEEGGTNCPGNDRNPLR
jgi:hypothetical protein